MGIQQSQCGACCSDGTSGEDRAAAMDLGKPIWEDKEVSQVDDAPDEPEQQLAPSRRSNKKFVTKTKAEMDKISAQAERSKRRGICAEVVTDVQVQQFVKPVHPKSHAEDANLKEIMKNNEKMQVLCGHLAGEALQDVINAFFLKEVKQGEDVIKQGDDGDCLYICEEGSLEVFVARPGPGGKLKPGVKGDKVLTVGPGALFGELALMYMAPRAATVTVTSPAAKLWALEREAFKILLAQTTQQEFTLYQGWLTEVPILKCFNHHELGQIIALLESDLYDADEDIISQGDPADNFYIVEDGTCSAFMHGKDGEKEVKQYNTGDYFGEIGLITGSDRKATVRATGEGCCVVSVSKEDFENVLAPCRDLLKSGMEEYPSYEDVT